MLEQNGFDALIDDIMRQGYSEAEAARLAALIGDTPTIDQDGNLVVYEDGREVAKLAPVTLC